MWPSSWGATKIALGHHRDDLIETLLLNQFFAGQIKSMAPVLRSDDRRNTIVRPLALCAEAEHRRVRRRAAASRSSRATCAARRRT
jgi:tRNA(Ile)-lysidine synthase TilS/MesJ